MSKKDWKGCPPRVREICIVDDDEDKRRQYAELIGYAFPKLNVRAFGSIYNAYRSGGRYDYLLIDVSSVAPLMMGDFQHAWGPITRFMQEHTATEVIIISAASRNATQEVIDEVAKHCAPGMVHYGGIGMWESSVELSLKNVLHNLIKPVDMEWTKIKSKRK